MTAPAAPVTAFGAPPWWALVTDLQKCLSGDDASGAVLARQVAAARLAGLGEDTLNALIDASPDPVALDYAVQLVRVWATRHEPASRERIRSAASVLLAELAQIGAPSRAERERQALEQHLARAGLPATDR